MKVTASSVQLCFWNVEPMTDSFRCFGDDCNDQSATSWRHPLPDVSRKLSTEIYNSGLVSTRLSIQFLKITILLTRCAYFDVIQSFGCWLFNLSFGPNSKLNSSIQLDVTRKWLNQVKIISIQCFSSFFPFNYNNYLYYKDLQTFSYKSFVQSQLEPELIQPTFHLYVIRKCLNQVKIILIQYFSSSYSYSDLITITYRHCLTIQSFVRSQLKTELNFSAANH